MRYAGAEFALAGHGWEIMSRGGEWMKGHEDDGWAVPGETIALGCKDRDFDKEELVLEGAQCWSTVSDGGRRREDSGTGSQPRGLASGWRVGVK